MEVFLIFGKCICRKAIQIFKGENEEHRSGETINGEFSGNSADNFKYLEDKETDRLKQDKERAEQKKNKFNKSQRHKQSKQRHKSYGKVLDTKVIESIFENNESSVGDQCTFNKSIVGDQCTFNKSIVGVQCTFNKSIVGGSSISRDTDNIPSSTKTIEDTLSKKNPFDNNEPPKLRKAKSSSLKIYKHLCNKYFISIVCKSCLIDVRATTSQCKYELLRNPNHICSSDHLAVKEKQTKVGFWTLVRDVRGKKSKVLCHQFVTGQQCRMGYQCHYPHTIAEMEMWFKYFNSQTLPLFVEDLSKSDLQLRIELMEFSKISPGLFLYYCSKCHHKGNNLVFEAKKKHVSQCRAGHHWIGKLFYKENARNYEIHSVTFQCNDKACLLFYKLLSFGFKEEDIVSISESVKQSMDSGMNKKIKFNVFGYEELEGDAEFVEPAIQLKEAIDKSVADLISFPFQNLDESFKRDMEEEYNMTVDETNKPYYRMFTSEKLKELLQSEKESFKKCRFNLKGTNRAVCDILDVNKDAEFLNVELRSRKNCGPCFDGDEVVVELKNTKELGDDGLIVKRGTVVGLLNHAFDRREYTFLCKMDPHVNHLMIPVNGVGPKIHVLREKNRYDCKNMVFIYKFDDEFLQLKKSCYLSHEEKEETLFVVKYIEWKFSNMYPLGYVCGILKSGNTIEETQMILDVLYQIPANYDLDDDRLDETISTNSEEDLTNLLTISIDPKDSRSIDDAISIKRLSDGQFNLIIHITDVSRFVSVGDQCDKEASKRMVSYYPMVGQVRSMLPKKLSEDHCSLLEGKTRWTISVYFHCSASGDIDLQHQPVIKEAIIKNKKQLSYKQVQDILNKGKADGDLNSFLLNLFSISQKLRKKRLKMGWMYRQELEQPFSIDQCFEAHQLIEELMILTNITVAKFIVNKFPSVVPLRCHDRPNNEKSNDWKQEWSYLLDGSTYFDQYFDKQFHGMEELVTFLEKTVLKVDECIMEEDGYKKVIQLIGNESKHPLHAIALMAWYSIQERSFYACSGDDEVKNKYHFGMSPSGASLTDFTYVQFTSPIRRYLDIVVHRLVKAALNHDTIPPYTCTEVTKLCHKANIILAESRKYHREVNLTKLTKHLERPFYVPVFISNVSEISTDFESPFLPKLSARYKQIKHNQLSLSDKPHVQMMTSSTHEDLRLMWDKKIFDADKDVFQQPHAREDCSYEVSIDPKRHVYEVNVSLWREFLTTLNEGNMNEIQSKWRHVKQKMRNHTYYKMGLTEVTSEMKDDGFMIRPQIKFSLNLRKGSVLPVQLGIDTIDGYLRPQIKMINITNQFDICLCHKRNPVECFVSHSKMFTQDRYLNVAEYLKTWFSILSMEEASTAVDSGDSILCHNVPTCIQKENDSYYGRVEMGGLFCRKRKISVEAPHNDGLGVGDFLCIRFPIKSNDESFIPNKWVCHAVVIHDSEDESKRFGKTMSFSFKIQHFDCTPPDELLTGSYHQCTIEFLSKPLSERKMSEALAGLEGSSELCQLIALGHSMDHLKNSLFIPEYGGLNTFDVQFDKICNNNLNQSYAIHKALTQPFTLIQGPPGTGKTVTAVKIAWWFARANQKEGRGKQVMYCGPSNSSVDVAAEWLKKMGHNCPKIIRVYGKHLEKQWYPLPRCSSNATRNNTDILNKDNNKNCIDLHHLIRKRGKPFANEISTYDRKFRKHLDDPETISDKEVNNYEKLLDDASKEELKHYDIILCTCIASSSSRLKSSIFAQLIIDECGMCKEPESLIPLINHKEINQVVLIGDHKQLQPIVKNKTASELGLKVSLFERYKDEAFMLNQQYRMHKKICEFPSKHFYEGNLKTFKTYFIEFLDFWLNPNVPLVFCHVEGAEQSVVISTSEGNEASKSNKIEAMEVIRICREIRGRSEYSSICILSQYGAQCSLLKQQQAGFNVSTVVSSQGNEYDYVVLSLVRSMPEYEIEQNPSIGWCLKNLGFITDEHQINVALTRAKHGLIIIGNKHLLRCNELFKELLRDYERMGCVINCKEFLPSFNRFRQKYLGDKFGRSSSTTQNYQ